MRKLVQLLLLTISASAEPTAFPTTSHQSNRASNNNTASSSSSSSTPFANRNHRKTQTANNNSIQNTQKLICFKNQDIKISSSPVSSISNGVLKWRRDNLELSQSGVGLWVTNSEFTPLGTTPPKYDVDPSAPEQLTIKNCDFPDAGIYTLEVISPQGNRPIDKQIELIVLQKPETPIVEKSERWRLNGYMLEDATELVKIATCQTVSKPAARHSWILTVNGTNVRTITSEMLSTKDLITGVSTDISYLKLAATRDMLGYQFVCQVNYDIQGSKYQGYSVSENDSKSVQLQNQIKSPFDVQYQPDDPELFLNGTNIMCRTRSRPSPQYRIRFLKPDSESMKDYEYSSKNYVGKDPWLEELARLDRGQIKKLREDPNYQITPEDLSKIVCFVKNSHGEKKISKSVEQLYKGPERAGFLARVKENFSDLTKKIRENKPTSYIIVALVVMVVLALIGTCSYYLCCRKKRDEDHYDEVGTMKTTDANSEFGRFRKNSQNSEQNNRLSKSSRITAKSERRRKAAWQKTNEFDSEEEDFQTATENSNMIGQGDYNAMNYNYQSNSNNNSSSQRHSGIAVGVPMPGMFEPNNRSDSASRPMLSNPVQEYQDQRYGY